MTETIDKSLGGTAGELTYVVKEELRLVHNFWNVMLFEPDAALRNIGLRPKSGGFPNLLS